MKGAPGAGARRAAWALAAVAALLVGCLRRAGDGGEAAGGGAVELRDARGHVTFSVRPTADGALFVDHATGAEGRLTRAGAGVVRATAAGGAWEAIPGAAGGAEVRGPRGPALRLSRVDGTLRLADGHEIPRGRVRREGDAFFAHDASGAVVAQARAEGGRVVVGDRSGAARGFVTGPLSAETAALLFLTGLQPVERALLIEAARGETPR